MFLKFLDESYAGTWVGVAAIHEAVDIYFLKAIMFGDIAQCEQMVER